MSVLDKFLKYARIKSESGSWDTEILEELIKDLEYLKIDCERDINGYIYGIIPATKGYEDKPTIGLIAHYDIFPDIGTGGYIIPDIVNGSDKRRIITSDGKIFTKDMLHGHSNEDIVISIGDTVLGADDKAGIAEILSACEYILKNNIPHGRIAICFNPDEEIGRGMDNINLSKFPADFAYTIDGDEVGNIGCENFYAAHVDIDIHGHKTHLGFAKNSLVNAISVAYHIMSRIPVKNQRPENTSGYEGFFHVKSIEGNESLCKLQILIRAFQKEEFDARKKLIDKICNNLNTVSEYKGRIDWEIVDDYKNMYETLKDDTIIDRVINAFKQESVGYKLVPIRGATDGATLSWKGIPCPNISSGALNFHSIYEFIPVKSLEVMTKVIVNILKEEEIKNESSIS